MSRLSPVKPNRSVSGEFAPGHRLAAQKIDQFFFRSVAVLLAAALLIVLSSAWARADEPAYIKPGDAGSGTLLFPAVDDGQFIAAPLVGTDIDVTISGPTARTRVTQHFYNPSKGWVEGVYVFPLPENAAVDTLKMVIGKRVIVAEIKERQEAKRIYEQAKAEGKKAGLMEQERPNMFTNSVANIGPGEAVVIQLEYQQTVPQSAGAFSLRVPLVVAPRYLPDPVVQMVNMDGKGWGRIADSVSDRDRITPPVLNPDAFPPSNPVTLNVKLQAGFPLASVKSHHHPVKIETPSDDIRLIKIEGAVPADKDFELSWSAAPGQMPAAGLFHEKVNGEDYLLALLTPPAIENQKRIPREIIFVIDNSGSMAGESMNQAKASVHYALGRLLPEDRFNIIRFDDTMEQLYPSAVPANMEYVGRAKTYIQRLDADGGTEMVPAMRAALADDLNNKQSLRQIVFLTDGAIGNEAELFSAIAAGRGRSRIFMVGIGSAPNSYLMNRAAELGRGSFTHIGSSAQVTERMRDLFGKLEKPAVTDIAVKFSDGNADMTPQILPDLYAGEPLEIAAKLGSMKGTLDIRGMIGDQPWKASLRLSDAAGGKGISKVWARAKIADAEVALQLRQRDMEAADKIILDLALRHNLISRLTSLVAVDKTPSRPDNAALSRADIPLNLPAGWDFEKVFGKQATPAEQHAEGEGSSDLIEAAYVEKIAASHQPLSAHAKAKQSTANLQLPQTATSAAIYLWAGFVLLLFNLSIIWFVWRREIEGVR